MKTARTHLMLACMLCVATGLALAACAAVTLAGNANGAESAHRNAFLEQLQTFDRDIAEFDSAGQALVAGGSPDLRERYDSVRAAMRRDLDEARALAGQNTRALAYVASLERHIYRRLAQIDAAIVLRAERLETLAPEVANVLKAAMARNAELGVAEMQVIRDLTARLEAEQHTLIERERATRSAQAKRWNTLASTMILLGSALQVVAAVVIFRVRRASPALEPVPVEAVQPRTSRSNAHTNPTLFPPRKELCHDWSRRKSAAASVIQ